MRQLLILVIIISSSHWVIGQPNSNEIDSLKKELSQLTDGNPYKIYLKLFGRYLDVSNDSSLRYAELAVAQALSDKDSLGIVMAYNARGNAKSKLGRIQAISDFEYALSLSQRNQYSKQTMFLLNNLAIAHKNFGRYEESLKYNFQSLEIRRELGDPISISIALNNIGVVYLELLDCENALTYLTQSRELKEQNGIIYDLDRAYVSIAEAHLCAGDTTHAIEAVRIAFDLGEMDDMDDVLADARYVMAKIFIGRGEYDKAIDELKKNIAFASESGLRDVGVQAFYQMAIISWLQNRHERALTYLAESDEALKNTELNQLRLNNYLLYSKIFDSMNDIPNAFDYQRRYLSLKDSLHNGIITGKFSQIQLDAQKKELDAIIQDKEIKIQTYQTTTILTAVIVVLLVVVSLLLFFGFRSRGRINKILDAKVKERTRELVVQNQELNLKTTVQQNINARLEGKVKALTATLNGLKQVIKKDGGIEARQSDSDKREEGIESRS